MPDEERMHNFGDHQEELPVHDGRSPDGSLGARTLTITLFVAIGVLVVLLVLLLR